VLSSLRVRLPLLFLAGIVLSSLVTTAISVRLFQDFAHDQTLAELRREAAGIGKLYSDALRIAHGNEPRRPPTFVAESLERASGDRIYYYGPPPFPGEPSGLRKLDITAWTSGDPLTPEFWTTGERLTFELRPRGQERTFLAVTEPVRVGEQPVGAIVVAKEKTDIAERVRELVERLAIAGAVGLLIAGLLAWYLSRTIVRPVLALARAADEVAAGNYAVEIPEGGAGEIGQLAERFDDMTARLAEAEVRERNFLMSVSHELRTPLTAIRGHVAAMLEGVVEDPEQRTLSLEVIEAESRRLERLVGDILDLAKLDAHRFTVRREEVDMEQLVEQAYETFSEEARRRSIEYRVDVHDRPVIVSDGDRVLQIVDNLLSNAFRATPDGGRITLELQRANGQVHVAVEDTGPGIAPEQRERLFRAFVSEAGGTGLGLTIAKELSSALGGRIDLDSEVGRGSRFELVLPAT
jgi:signal transduction histidine kinase